MASGGDPIGDRAEQVALVATSSACDSDRVVQIATQSQALAAAVTRYTKGGHK